MDQLFAQERKRNAEDKAGMQNDIDGLRNEQIIKDFKRMAILRVNCLHDIINKLYKSQSEDLKVSEDPHHSSSRNASAAKNIHEDRERFRRDYPGLDDSCFRLIRDFSMVSMLLLKPIADINANNIQACNRVER